MPDTGKKRKSMASEDSSALTKAERRAASLKKARERFAKKNPVQADPPTVLEVPDTEANSSPVDGMPPRKKRMIQGPASSVADPTATSASVPQGMSKKEVVAWRKQQIREKYEKGQLGKGFSPPLAPKVESKPKSTPSAVPEARDPQPANPISKLGTPPSSLHPAASTGDSKPKSTSGSVLAAGNLQSTKSSPRSGLEASLPYVPRSTKSVPLPPIQGTKARRSSKSSKPASARTRTARRPSGPFNSPVPEMKSMTSNVRGGPHMPDFAGDSLPSTNYLSPRSSLKSNTSEEGLVFPPLPAKLHNPASVEIYPGVKSDLKADTIKTPNTTHRVDTFVSPSSSTVSVSDARDTPSNEVVVVEGGEEETAISLSSYRNFWLTRHGLGVLGCLCLLAAVCVAPVSHPIGKFQLALEGGSGDRLPCYFDSSEDIPGGDIEKASSRCANLPMSMWSACPHGAMCSQGLLKACSDPEVFEPSEKGEKCIPNEQARNHISEIVRLLQVWTVTDLCAPGGSPYVIERDDSIGSSRHFFWFSQLLGELDIPWNPNLLELLSAMDDVIQLDYLADGNLKVALDANYHLHLPGRCRAKKFIRHCMEAVWVSFFLTSKFIWGHVVAWLWVYCELVVEVPFMTLIFSIVLPICGWLAVSMLLKKQKEQREQRQLEVDRALFREEVYNVLRKEPSKHHVTLIVRDQILFDRNLSYHTDSKARSRITKRVWSKVVSDIQRDNRVLKSRIQSGEGVRDAWKWGDATS